MSRAAVDEIFKRIQDLSEDERLILERRLSESLEREWEKESRKVRREAKRRGLNQVEIDRAVREARYSR